MSYFKENHQQFQLFMNATEKLIKQDMEGRQ